MEEDVVKFAQMSLWASNIEYYPNPLNRNPSYELNTIDRYTHNDLEVPFQHLDWPGNRPSGIISAITWTSHI
jgi:hypothetical protein